MATSDGSSTNSSNRSTLGGGARSRGWLVNVSDTHSVRVDPSWWTRPDLQDALASRDVAAIYHFLRGRGFSQTRIAALSGQNQSEVSAILAHGRQVTAYDVLARIADGLSIPRGLMGLAYIAPVAVIRDGADSTEGRHVRRRAFMGVAAKITMGAALAAGDLAILATPAAAGPTPDHIGLSDVRRIADMTAALDRQDLCFGGGSCREAIVGYLNWATKLRHATMTDDVRRALDTELAHLEELAGWTSYDLLLLDSAEHFFLRALHSARLAEYPFMAAKALARLGEIYVQDGQYGDALRVFQLATIPAREADSAHMSAFLYVNDARIHARRSDAKAVEDAIRRAQDDYADTDHGQQPRQTRFLNNGTFHNRIALAYTDLAEHNTAFAAHALDAATTAASQCNHSETRALLARLYPLALNAYRIADVTVANETTGQIVAGLPQVSSRRLTARLRLLATEAAAHDSTAADLAHQLTTGIASGAHDGD
jgi:tetratricopeptide (TPR) repeat protein